ncbi:LOW QUALITY PROTEIN: probable protein phosphatase 2C 23 [Dioscorea cayenensis subsp. rotundata]|uniref:protein-serine/threonine phosphatase n=1 Tax=Dioscorea cayennensis subsp. rotundata TaxID=55577 RepID=A0AB40BXK5_DIOCR|nr:LOW QUALITY PROTEIN: probable protein phosphatase 2C 23 [Dioscorea cayenensis subsp. rotundata]
MGNTIAKFSPCFNGGGGGGGAAAAAPPEPYDDPNLGHAFCYLRPNDTTIFRTISGAALGANASTPPSTSELHSLTSHLTWPAAANTAASGFESSTSFSSVPLQPVPRFSSGPLSSSLADRGFLSGPIERGFLSGPIDPRSTSTSTGSSNLIGSSNRTTDSSDSIPIPNRSNLHWAQGKAGEDRVHVVVSDEHAWLFVGIYDGFNGPDAPDYLLSNLYSAIHSELKGILWDDESPNPNWPENHLAVLKALWKALKKTEEAYLGITDKMVMENPELALMGSCVLVMLMKGEDVYLMNVGDSRAVLAQRLDFYSRNSIEKENQGLEMMMMITDGLHDLAALQLTIDHSTCVLEEVERIRDEHPDDACAIVNDRVKGSLNVTRAFGAGFLKQPKWNNALLEVFRIDYIGNKPYLSCTPSLYHHKISSKDRFLILSSDGLYQYFTNDEAVSQVELFITMCPEGDPAQHLVKEVLFRAAAKAGMEFHELLEIPQGDRRRYHDDVSIIVISLEGRIWRSCV